MSHKRKYVPAAARRLPLIVAAAAVSLWPALGMAQSAPTPETRQGDGALVAVAPSVEHSALKGVTLRTGVALKDIAIYSLGLGTVAGAGALTAITTAGGYVLYTTNEYLWDRYNPNTNVSANKPSFDQAQSAWRNTAKWLTLKPALVALDWGAIYLWTGSLTATVAMGGAVSLTGPLVFYANNTAWDWYDWYANGGAPRRPPGKLLTSR